MSAIAKRCTTIYGPGIKMIKAHKCKFAQLAQRSIKMHGNGKQEPFCKNHLLTMTIIYDYSPDYGLDIENAQ